MDRVDAWSSYYCRPRLCIATFGGTCRSIFPCFFTPSALYIIMWDRTNTADLREQIKPYIDLLTHYVSSAWCCMATTQCACSNTTCKNVTSKCRQHHSVSYNTSKSCRSQSKLITEQWLKEWNSLWIGQHLAATLHWLVWGAIWVKIKTHVAFIFPVGIYGIHNGNLLKSPLSGHICSDIC